MRAGTLAPREVHRAQLINVFEPARPEDFWQDVADMCDELIGEKKALCSQHQEAVDSQRGIELMSPVQVVAERAVILLERLTAAQEKLVELELARALDKPTPFPDPKCFTCGHRRSDHQWARDGSFGNPDPEGHACANCPQCGGFDPAPRVHVR